jgi:hypothetical protein
MVVVTHSVICPDINLKLATVEVKTEVRAIKCNWTVEMASDIYYFGNINLYRKNKIKSIYKLDNGE